MLVVTPVRSLFAVVGLAAIAAPQSWSTQELAVLTNPSFASSEFMGQAVAIDGGTAFVGIPGWQTQGVAGGRVLVYERDSNGVFQKVQELEPPSVTTSTFQWSDPFGRSVAVDGATAVVGGNPVPKGFNLVGSAMVYERESDGIWYLTATLTASDAIDFDEFGESVSISGNRIVVGAPGADLPGTPRGAAYAFERSSPGLPWVQLVKLSKSQSPVHRFGHAVAANGNYMVVGDPGASKAYLYRWEFPWIAIELSPTGVVDQFGDAVALEGSFAAVGDHYQDTGGTNTGAVHLFLPTNANESDWSEVGRLTAIPQVPAVSTRYFGQSIAIENGLIAVGVRHAEGSSLKGGSVHVFHRDQGGPDAMGAATVVVPGSAETEDFGAAVSLDASTLLAGDPARFVLEGHPSDKIQDLALDSSGTLFGADKVADELVQIDPSTGLATLVGSLGSPRITGLAWDGAGGVLYGVDGDNGALVTIDRQTGQATTVGPLGFASVQGLAWEPTAALLYSVDNATRSLIRIDPTSGAGSLVGPTGQSLIWGLAFDAGSGVLYGLRRSSGGMPNFKLVTFDIATGAATAYGSSLSYAQPRGLAFDAASGELLSTDSDTDVLLRIDPVDGSTSAVGAFEQNLFGVGITYIHQIDHQPTNYCTAGVSAIGCQATLSASGSASASAPSGFQLSATPVEGGLAGLFFFGTNGRQANPWGSGTSFQCVVPPVHRLSLQFANGSAGTCSGSFQQDVNALWCATCAHASKNPGAGALVQSQLWYRDPFSTSNQTTSLSDAIEFLVEP